MSRIDALQVSTGETGPALTPQQKRFNTLLRQIAQARALLSQWHDGIAQYREAHAQVLLPLHTELTAARRQWVFALDALSARQGLTRAERDTLRELVCDAAGALLDACDDDAPLKALFAKHAEVDFETERQRLALAMKNLTEAVTGLDLGDDEGIASDADLYQRMQERLRQQAQAGESERSAQAQAQAPGHRSNAAQRRREAEAQQATQSVREIFRKLASALHPDRESDAGERQRKTELMQQVNQAYGANDLLTLLELQLQFEQIDAGHMAGASAERLKHYNKVLAGQLQELRTETAQVQMRFGMDFGVGGDFGWGLAPHKLGALVEQERRRLRAEIGRQQIDMKVLTDLQATKRWLKRQRRLLQDAELDSDPF